ncbi:MAG: PqqD family protein [Prevotella sp.]|jgi:hypothetical protein|nr:PqqD family protein [Prevotella sp.]
MKIKNGFVLREVCGENVIVGEGLGAVNFGKLLALNETAAWLWKEALAIGDFSVEQLAERLCEEYDVTMDEAKQDVAAILDEWQEVGVVEKSE